MRPDVGSWHVSYMLPAASGGRLELKTRLQKVVTPPRL